MIRTLMLALTVLCLTGCGSAQKKEWKPPIYTKAMMPVCPTGTVRMVDYTYHFLVSEKLAEFDQEVTVGCYELDPQNTYRKDGRLQYEDLDRRGRWLVGPAISYQIRSKRVFWEQRITDRGTEQIFYARPLSWPNELLQIHVNSCGGIRRQLRGTWLRFAFPCGDERDYWERVRRSEKAWKLNRWPKSAPL